MTTAHSPLSALKLQADRIARVLKETEAHHIDHPDYSPQLAQVRRIKELVSFGVVMDDKTLVVEMAWDSIRDMSHAALSDWILNRMRESGETKQ